MVHTIGRIPVVDQHGVRRLAKRTDAVSPHLRSPAHLFSCSRRFARRARCLHGRHVRKPV